MRDPLPRGVREAPCAVALNRAVRSACRRPEAHRIDALLVGPSRRSVLRSRRGLRYRHHTRRWYQAARIVHEILEIIRCVLNPFG